MFCYFRGAENALLEFKLPDEMFGYINGIFHRADGVVFHIAKGYNNTVV